MTIPTPRMCHFATPPGGVSVLAGTACVPGTADSAPRPFHGFSFISPSRDEYCMEISPEAPPAGFGWPRFLFPRKTPCRPIPGASPSKSTAAAPTSPTASPAPSGKTAVRWQARAPGCRTCVLKLMACASRTGKTRGVQEVHIQVQKGLQQVGERVHGVAVVPVQRYDDVSGGGGEPALVRAPVAAQFLPDDLRPPAKPPHRRCGPWSCYPPR